VGKREVPSQPGKRGIPQKNGEKVNRDTGKEKAKESGGCFLFCPEDFNWNIDGVDKLENAAGGSLVEMEGKRVGGKGAR